MHGLGLALHLSADLRSLTNDSCPTNEADKSKSVSLGQLIDTFHYISTYRYIRRPLATARGARERRYECSGCGGFEHGLLCGGARSGPGDGAPDRCVFLRDPRATLDIDVRHGGLLFKPLNPLKSLKPLETCQKGLARGCSKMFFYRIRKRRETSRPARQTPQAPQISHQNVFLFFYGIQKRR